MSLKFFDSTREFLAPIKYQQKYVLERQSRLIYVQQIFFVNFKDQMKKDRRICLSLCPFAECFFFLDAHVVVIKKPPTVCF